ncbi:hypothetical protein ACFQ8S_32560 [Streptomyces virginiae]|uniref:hypothetical protein n=1 Tax=Streptomyces virginiae TaxID=1961 RepID=UPI0036AED3E4
MIKLVAALTEYTHMGGFIPVRRFGTSRYTDYTGSARLSQVDCVVRDRLNDRVVAAQGYDSCSRPEFRGGAGLRTVDASAEDPGPTDSACGTAAPLPAYARTASASPVAEYSGAL